jgi:FGGY-family pentulose kinase
MRQAAVIGVDVGTGSARAGVFDLHGRGLASASQPIRMWRPEPEYAEQSTDDIWAAVCAAVREAVQAAGELDVRGVGVDATCSLAAVDADGKPVSLSPSGDPARNVIVWMDHRALDQADAINATGADVLRYVGGRISPEMETPKLLWLAQRMPGAFKGAAQFFDLADFLTWRMTGDATRSLCTTVCKWTYLGHEDRWDAGYFREVGLGALADEGFQRIGTDVRPLGEAVGAGLTSDAAAALGLPPGVPVGVAAIDAHAGGIGTIGAALDGGGAPDDAALLRRLALIGGTSSCHMAVSPEPAFVPGVWGPYFSAMVPGLWLNEGGQSATGSLVDHVITSHAAYPELREAAGPMGVHEALNVRLDAMADGAPVATLTRDLHVLPYHHGNRSPRADPTLRGVISGLCLSATLDDLALLYLATVQAIAYGTRHIVEAMNARGYAVDTILASGGGTKNRVFLQAHADATGCRVVLPAEPEAVLLGAAVLGAVAGGAYPDVRTAMGAMTRAGRVVEPDGAVQRYHAAKYAVFQRMYGDHVAYRAMMRDGSNRTEDLPETAQAGAA